jgi:peptide/nickel transport system ATP-binding protein/oligopeptide transport system ATP-binding protein
MRGETFGVVGESGCGKSTLGRSLIRLLPVTEGKVWLNGQDISGLKGQELKQMRKKAQIIFQDPSACLNPRRNIRQILMEPFEIHGMKGPEVDKRIEELMHLVGLDTYHLSRYPHELSGGQLQRIAILRAMIPQPELLLADEAVSMLDVSVRADIINLFYDIAKNNQTSLIFISHDILTSSYLSDELCVMYRGRVAEYGKAEKIIRNPVHPYTQALIACCGDLNGQIRTDVLCNQTRNESGSGCPYSSRCPRTAADCSCALPELKPLEDGHFVRCIQTE